MVIAEDEMLERLDRGFQVERLSDMSEIYLSEVKRILLISGDTELLGAMMYYPNVVAGNVPDRMLGAVLAIIQDELGHAHIDYRLLEELGEDVDALMFDRPAKDFKHAYAMGMHYETFVESVVVGAFMDRAGYVLLSDIFEHTSYVPWRRALVKVNKEEHFHIAFGVRNLQHLSRDPDSHRAVQQAVDWMFPMTVEWFGLPDSMKTHDNQLRYHLKGLTNDQLRQEWLSQVVPLMDELGYKVPAHLDASTGHYLMDFPLPCAFDADARRWDFSKSVTWTDVVERWKAQGPWTEQSVDILQSGRHGLDRLRMPA